MLNKVVRDWGDGTYTFCLTHKEIYELEAKCDRGLEWLLREVVSGAQRTEHLREAVRLGLIGGGLGPTEALKLVRQYFEGEPGLENKALAYAILNAAAFRPKDVKPGKATRRPKTPSAGAGPSQPSSEQPAQSA